MECWLYELREGLKGIEILIEILLDQIKQLNTSEIREMILKTQGEERLFYVLLLNKVMKLRRIETLENERMFGNYNQMILEKEQMSICSFSMSSIYWKKFRNML